jgi:hypothetical protein
VTTQVIPRNSFDTRSDASHSSGSYSPRRAARIAGISYLTMFVLAIFANFVVREGLIEPGDPCRTSPSTCAPRAPVVWPSGHGG